MRTSGKAHALDFEGDNVASFEFCPDTSIPLPEELKWMDNKEELIFRGKKIDTTFFLTETKYYDNPLKSFNTGLMCMRKSIQVPDQNMRR
ncbi:hypothetical protein ACSBL2_11900 [Pedobacter sp. AW31-3R]|uniref:hypothetical protein n=1 Tax=Pedobacter sp. AW31-3R TaxID=3445781 RepID=UPI003FA01CCB